MIDSYEIIPGNNVDNVVQRKHAIYNPLFNPSLPGSLSLHLHLAIRTILEDMVTFLYHTD